MLGNWTGVEQQAAHPRAPATTARAMIVFKLDVVDQVVVQDYRQVRADQVEFSGHGVFMIDRTGGTSSSIGAHPLVVLRLRWLPPQPAHGGWQDGELILEKDTSQGIAEHHFAVADGQLSYRIRLRPDPAWQDLGERDTPTRQRALTPCLTRAADSDSAAEGELIAAGQIAGHGRNLQVIAITEDVVSLQADAAHVAQALFITAGRIDRLTPVSGRAIWDVAILFALFVALARLG